MTNEDYAQYLILRRRDQRLIAFSSDMDRIAVEHQWLMEAVEFLLRLQVGEQSSVCRDGNPGSGHPGAGHDASSQSASLQDLRELELSEEFYRLFLSADGKQRRAIKGIMGHE